MKIIEDKEVGQMWKDETNNPPDMFGLHDQIIALIRKLVDEEYWRQLSFYKSRNQLDPIVKIDCHDQALKKYGINPADWKDDD